MSGCSCTCHLQPESVSNPQRCPLCNHAFGRFAPQPAQDRPAQGRPVGRTALVVAQQRQLATRVANDRQIFKEQALRDGTWPSVTQQAGQWAKGAAIGYVLSKVWRHVVHGQ